MTDVHRPIRRVACDALHQCRSNSNLFEMEPAPWELDAAREQLVATVVFPSGPEKPFDYSVPDGLRSRLWPGRACGRRLAGRSAGDRLLRAAGNAPDVQRRLKPLAAVVDQRTLLSPTMLRLTAVDGRPLLCRGAGAGGGVAGGGAIARRARG